MINSKEFEIYNELLFCNCRNDDGLSTIVLDPRFLCNVEAASRHHPENVVCILLHLPSHHRTLRKLAAKIFKLDKRKTVNKKVN